MPCTSVNTTLQHATDAAILEFAREHSLIVVSEDTDFGELLAQQRTAALSFVLHRTHEPITPDKQTAVLLANLPRVRGDLEQGAVVVIERSRLWLRRSRCCIRYPTSGISRARHRPVSGAGRSLDQSRLRLAVAPCEQGWVGGQRPANQSASGTWCHGRSTRPLAGVCAAHSGALAEFEPATRG